MTKEFTVTDTIQRTRLSPAGREERVYIVHIKTNRGAIGSIEIDERDWKPESVVNILSEFAAKLDTALMLNEMEFSYGEQ